MSDLESKNEPPSQQPKPNKYFRGGRILAAILATGIIGISLFFSSQRASQDPEEPNADKSPTATYKPSVSSEFEDLAPSRESHMGSLGHFDEVQTQTDLSPLAQENAHDETKEQAKTDSTSWDYSEKKKAAQKKEARRELAANAPMSPGGLKNLQKDTNRTYSANESYSRSGAQHLSAEALAQMRQGLDEYKTQNDQTGKESFLRNSEVDTETISQIYEPLSPFTVFAGGYIPAILQTALNSDLPGNLTAVVSRNVYDTISGRHLIIPQGTRVLGSYSSSVTYGQSRALIVWNRLIFPNGNSVNLGSMPGVDLSGQSGFSDMYSSHIWEIFGNALMVSVIQGIGQAVGNVPLVVDSSGNTSVTLGSGPATALTGIVRKGVNRQPTIKIRPGYLFNVYVLKDLALKPYPDSFKNSPIPSGFQLAQDTAKKTYAVKGGPR